MDLQSESLQQENPGNDSDVEGTPPLEATPETKAPAGRRRSAKRALQRAHRSTSTSPATRRQKANLKGVLTRFRCKEQKEPMEQLAHRSAGKGGRQTKGPRPGPSSVTKQSRWDGKARARKQKKSRWDGETHKQAKKSRWDGKATPATQKKSRWDGKENTTTAKKSRWYRVGGAASLPLRQSAGGATHDDQHAVLEGRSTSEKGDIHRMAASSLTTRVKPSPDSKYYDDIPGFVDELVKEVMGDAA